MRGRQNLTLNNLSEINTVTSYCNKQNKHFAIAFLALKKRRILPFFLKKIQLTSNKSTVNVCVLVQYTVEILK